MCEYIWMGWSGLGKNCNVTVNMSQNVNSYVISHNLLKIYEVNIIWIYINTKYVPIYSSRAN